MALFCYDADAAELSGPGPYLARSADDENPKWPSWYVAGPDGRRNIMLFPGRGGAILTSREVAEEIASKANAAR